MENKNLNNIENENLKNDIELINNSEDFENLEVENNEIFETVINDKILLTEETITENIILENDEVQNTIKSTENEIVDNEKNEFQEDISYAHEVIIETNIKNNKEIEFEIIKNTEETINEEITIEKNISDISTETNVEEVVTTKEIVIKNEILEEENNFEQPIITNELPPPLPPIENTKNTNTNETKTVNIMNEEIIKPSRKELRAQKFAAKKAEREQKLAIKTAKEEQKIAERKQKNTRWFWFLILLLLAFILLFMWDNYKKTRHYKQVVLKLDSIKYSEVFYKSKFKEKDSSLNLLLANYNKLLQQNLESGKDLNDKQKELLRLQKIIYLQDSILRQVQNSLTIALSGYSKDEITVEMKNGKLYIIMRNKLLFPSGSAIVQTKGINALSTLSKVLNQNPNIDIMIEGHTDNVPIDPKTKEYKDNWDLSTARAIAVTRILIDSYKIQPERIIAAGRSMFYPTAPNTTEEGKSKNRRIEFILTPNLEELFKLTEVDLKTK